MVQQGQAPLGRGARVGKGLYLSEDKGTTQAGASTVSPPCLLTLGSTSQPIKLRPAGWRMLSRKEYEICGAAVPDARGRDPDPHFRRDWWSKAGLKV